MLARRQPLRRPDGNATSVPSPTGGWNARDSVADMDSRDAVILENWFPSATYVELRNGYSRFATVASGWVETLMSYTGGTTEKLFAAAGSVIYNVTAGGAGVSNVTALTNARFQYINNTTSGGSYIQCVNGADKMRVYDGTNWHTDGDGSPYNVTGVDTATCIGITLSHNRVWLNQTNTLKAWYLPTNSIGGAATAFDLSSFCNRGGYLMTIATWTQDAGQGMDDMTVFITSEGEVLVYRGTDPASSATWGLIGVFWIGSPIGRRCTVKYAGDLLIITRDGVQPLSLALQSTRINPRVSITDKIQSAVSSAVTLYGANYGWQLLPYPNDNMLFLNVPLQQNAIQQQYVMNTITRAWCNFTGWNAACWELYQDEPYFGGNAYVGKAQDTTADNGGVIQANGLQAFNYFGQRNREKQFTQMRPVLNTNGTPAIAAGMNLDFDTSNPSSSLAFSPSNYGVWGTSLWDNALWGPDFNVVQAWQGANGVGRCAAPHLLANSSGLTVQWLSTDVIWRPGGIFG